MKTLVLCLVACAAAACAPTKSVVRAIDKPNRNEFEQDRIDAAIARNAVTQGMTFGEVRKSLGNPQRKDYTTLFGEGRVRRWVYPYIDVYFDADGFVFGWREVNR